MIGALLWLVSLLARTAAALVAVLVMLHAGKVRVDHARCPGDRDLRTGIRRDGRFECWSHPIAPAGWRRSDGPIELWDGTYGRPDRSVQSLDVAEYMLLCRSGQPAVIDWQTVGCR